MNRTKEGQGLYRTEDLKEAINDLPSIIQERLTSSLIELTPGELLENLTEEQREGLQEHIKIELKDELRREFKQEFAEEYDEYLGLVIRKLFNINLSDLKPHEQRDISEIRKELKIPGSFNPDA